MTHYHSYNTIIDRVRVQLTVILKFNYSTVGLASLFYTGMVTQVMAQLM